MAGIIFFAGGFKGLMKKRWFIVLLCVTVLIPVMAPVLSLAAPTEKTMTVVAQVTVDGVPADVKVTVTYDMPDEVILEGETDLIYKQNGKSNYKLVAEKGYYNSSYAEKNAAFVDRLVGDYLGSSTKAGIVNGAEMFSDSASKTLLLGKTTDSASTQALSMISKNQWIITEISGKLVVTGWYDTASMEAAKFLYSEIEGKTDVTLKLPIIGTVNYAHASAPDFTAGTFLNGYDSEQGAVLLRYNNITEANFNAYKQTLVEDGWTLYQENALQGVSKQSKFATYVKGDDVVNVQYLPQDITNTSSIGASTTCAANRIAGDEIRIILEKTDTLFQNETGTFDLSHVGGVAQTPALHVVNLNKSAADGNDVGACMIYTLADGSFLVWDGGDEMDGEQVMKALRHLNKRDDGIVIAAWVLTHAHGDHVGAYGAIASGEYAEELTVEAVVFNRPSKSYNFSGNHSLHNAASRVETLLENFKGDTRFIIPHLGQEMQIRNLNLVNLYVGEEDQFPIIYNNDNTASLICSVTYDGIDQNVVMLADSTNEAVKNVVYPLFVKELDCDILMASHHGLYSMAEDIYPTFIANTGKKEEVVIWNTSIESIKNNNYSYYVGNGTYTPAQGAANCYIGPNKSADDLNRLYTSLNKPLRDCAKEDIFADTYMTTLNFPYAVGDSIRTYIGDYESDYFDAEDVKVAYLPAFRFQNTFDTNSAKYLEVLKGYNADVLVISQLAQKCTMYENIDYINGLKMDYPYYYWASAWTVQDGADLTSGDGTAGTLILSRYPILEAETIYLTEPAGGTVYKTSAEGGYTEGRSAAHLVLNVDGLTLDLYASHFDTSAAALFKTAFATEEYKPVGDYWMIVSNGNVLAASAADLDTALGVTGSVDAGLNSGNYEVYLSSGSVVSKATVDTAWAGTSGYTGNKNMGNGFIIEAQLSRKVLAEAITPEPFTAPVSVGTWWCNYKANNIYKAQVLDWLLENRHEIVALTHVTEDVQSEEGAKAFAEMAGYDYYAYVTSWTRGGGAKVGHLLLSKYPIESKDVITLRADGGSSEGRAYLHAVVDMTADGFGKVDVYVGENDYTGKDLEAQRAILEQNVQANAESGREFIICGFDEGHIGDTYAGKSVRTYHSGNTTDGFQCIITSAGIPMSGRMTYGTQAYPVDGLSQIPIALANISNYVKVDLVQGVEYTLTVNGTTGSGKFEAGQKVSLSFDDRATGKQFLGWTVNSGNVTIEDLSKATIEFKMPAENVEITANYNDVPVEGKMPSGEKLNLKVLSIPAFRFGNAYNATYADQINEALLSYGADIIGIPQVDNSINSYNKTNVPGQIAEALKSEYPYSYYAPIWQNEEAGNMATGEGTVGHMILSKYKILESEAILADPSKNGYSSGETRGAARVLIELDANTTVEVYVVYNGSASEWENYNSSKDTSWAGDYWMVLGGHKTNATTIAGYYGQTSGNASVNGGDSSRPILSSIGLTPSNWGYNSKINGITGLANPAEAHWTDIEVALLDSYGVNYGTYINNEEYGFFKENATVTMTAPAKIGYAFKEWILPEGLELTQGNVESNTIKFVMPDEFLYFEAVYEQAPVANVIFNGNGGTGNMLNVLANKNNPFELPTCEFTAPFGMQFKGWALSANGDVITTATITLSGDVELFAVWEKIPNFLTLTTVSTFRFGSWPSDDKFTNNKDALLAELKTYDTDVLALMQVNGGNTSYSATNQYQAIKDGLADIYPYAYFAPVWSTPAEGVTADATTGNGYIGNMILSKYPFVSTEHIYLGGDKELAGTGTGGEGRGVAHVVINVNGVNVDLFGTHLRNQVDWGVAGLKSGIANANDAWIAMGSIYGGYDISSVLGETVKNVFSSQYDFVGSSAVSFFGSASDADLAAIVANCSTAYTVGVQLPTAYQVTFNGNGGTGTMSATTSTGSFKLPECTILPPSGKTFKGWATSANGEVLTSLKITENTELFAIWEDYNYPVIEAPAAGDATNKITMIQWWGVGRADNPAANAAAYLAQSAYHPDVVALQHAQNMDATAAAEFAASAGYTYHVYAVADSRIPVAHILMSKYPIQLVDTFILTDESGTAEARSFLYATVNVDGTYVDVVVGENMGGTSNGPAKQNALYLEPWVYDLAKTRENPLIIAGYKFSNADDTSFAAPTFTRVTGGSGTIIYGSGITANNPAVWQPEDVDTALGKNNDPGYVELTIKDLDPAPKTYTVTFNANGGTGSMSPATGVSGAYTLPVNGFTAPTGMQFKGWGLSANATAVISTLDVNGDVELFAIWEGISQKITAVEWWCNFGTDATKKATIANYLKTQNYDLVVLTHLNPAVAGDDTLAAALATEFGYSEFAYVVEKKNDTQAASSVHMLLSKYPLKNKAQLTSFTSSDGYDRVFGMATVTINGTDTDVFYGFFSGAATADQRTQVSNAIQAANTTANFVYMGGQFTNGATSFAGKTITLIRPSSDTAIAATTGLAMTNQKSIAQTTVDPSFGGAISELCYAELSIPYTKRATISFNANGGTGSMSSVSVPAGTTQALPQCGFTAPANKQFKGWSLTANGAILSGNQTVQADVTLFAIWEDIPNSFTVASLSTFAFGGSTNVSTKIESIKTGLLAFNADVITLQQIHRGPNKKTTEDQYTLIKDAMAAEYPYAYFAPVWDTYVGDGQTADIATGEGCMGHMILSKFPIVSGEGVYMSTDSDTTAEKRGAGHVVLNVRGTMVDVYFSQMKDFSNWSASALQTSIANANDAWIFTGSIYGGSDVAGAVSQTVKKAFNSRYDIIGSAAVSFTNTVTNSEFNTTSGIVNPDAVCIATVTVPQPYTVTFDGDGATGTMAAVAAYGNYKLPANGFNVPKGKTFKGWSLTKGGAVVDTIDVTADTKVYAVWESTSLKVAVLPTFRFQGTYNTNKTDILANLKAQNADVFVFTNVDFDKTVGYNTGIDLVATMKADLPEYPYSYFAPVWDKANTDTSAENIGFMGHLILSKYPIVETEVILQNSDARTNAKTTEDRGVLRAMLNVNGMTVDVFGCQVADKTQGWVTSETNKGLADIIKASKADTWIVAGNMYFASQGLSDIKTAVGDNNIVAACPDRYSFEGGNLWSQTNVIAKGGMTFTGGYYDYTIGTSPAYTNPDHGYMINPIYGGVVTLP